MTGLWKSFLQTWIFFGLLHELFADEGLYEESEYLSLEEGIRYVCTKGLIKRLDEWQRTVRTWDDARKTDKYDRLMRCLDLAEDSIRVLSQEPKTAVLVADREHPGFNRAIKQSLCALCEIVTYAVNRALLDKPEEARSAGSWMRIAWDFSIEQNMRANGWCPSEIAAVSSSLKTFAAQKYVSAMRKPGRGMSHAECTASVCEELRVELGTYVTGHRCEGRNCGFMSPETDKLLGLIEAGDIPVVKIRGLDKGDVVIDVVPHCGNVAYVALSHVWVDGLGNDKANELPRCQLERLQALIDAIREYKPRGNKSVETRELYFWCDTLCCPIANSQDETIRNRQKNAKKLVLANMRDIYARAAYCLVLDGEIQSYDYSSLGIVECALKVITSGWMHRLWTFQEAVFSKNLLIQFADDAIDLRTLRDGAEAFLDSDLSYNAISYDILNQIVTLQVFNMKGNMNIQPDIASVATSIRLRRVSNLADEALCIGSVLRLELSRIAESDEDAVEMRMSRFWEAAQAARRGIPKAILFTTFRRLRTPGLRWAPSSLQETAFGPNQLEVLTSPDDMSLRGIPTSNGLVARLPGWKVRVETPHQDMPPHLFPGNQLASNDIRLRHPDGTWFWIHRQRIDRNPEKDRPERPIPGRELCGRSITLWDILSDETKTFHLILNAVYDEDGARWGGLRFGVITSSEKTKDGTSIARSLMVIGVPMAESSDTTIWMVAYSKAMILRQERFESSNADGQAFERILQMADEAMQDERFAAVVQNAAIGDPQMYFATITATMFQGRFALIEEGFGPETEWCVD